MTGASPAIGHYLCAFESLAPELPGRDVPWLRETREGAIRRFAERGFPTPRDEDWKYTSVAAIEKRRFAPAPAAAVTLPASEVEGYCLSPLRVVLVDGRIDPALSSAADRPGLRVESLTDALRERPDEVAAFLDRFGEGADNGFAALGLAFLGAGVFVRVDDGVRLDNPLHLVMISSGQSDVAFQPRFLIDAGAGSEATVIESYITTGGGTYFTNATTEVALASGSRLEHYRIQQESLEAYHVGALTARQGRDSRFVSHSISLGARLARQDIRVHLDDEGAHTVMNGLYLAGGRQHVDHHTRVDHARPRGTSEEYYKGILDGRGRGVFNGRIYVHPDAQQSDARQANQNLLLSPHAEIDTKPQLEIYADDVKCSHGATVGQLDPLMLFYLRSRGVEEADARGMLIQGFTRDVLERMSAGPVRDHVEAALADRLPRPTSASAPPSN